MSLPYLTRDLPGIGGMIKQRNEDFEVTELPLYEPSGQGEHVFCEVRKDGITTFEAIQRLAEALNVNPRDIGYAGMKDAHAVARQLFSIPRVEEQAVMAVQTPQLAVQWATRSIAKLRLGHLRGNRFAIRIRDVDAESVVRVQPIVDILQKRGMPNYFGEQRFGHRGDNAALGAAIIRQDYDALIKTLLGSPVSGDDAQSAGARRAFDRGDFEQAMHLWPRRSGMERRVLARFIKTRKALAAARAVDERLRRLWVSALQSEMFNAVVSRRIEALDRLLDGDLAWKHANGAVFRVESAAAEQPRCDVFEISPTGPMVGYRMTEPAGEPQEMEQAILAQHSLKPGDFRQAGRHKVKGARRPLRVRPEDVQISGGADMGGPFVSLAFTLPAGSFATVLLREVMKEEGLEAVG